jgi:PAS domain S-box-containing protein
VGSAPTSADRLREELEATRHLLAAANALAVSSDLDEVLGALLDVLLETLGHTRAWVFLWDERRREATLAASRGERAPEPGMVLPFDTLSSTTRAALVQRRTTVVDYAALPPAERGPAARLDSHVSLQVPLVQRGRLVGVVSLDDPGERREFSAREIELAAGIAAQAAVAIENARLVESLKRAEIRFKATFDFAAVGIVIGDLDGCIVDSNRAFEAMLGFDQSETRGRMINDFTFAEEMVRDNRLLQEMVAGARESYELVEKRFVRKDGSIIWVSVGVSLVRDAEGEPQFTIAVVEDVTEERRAREALEEKDASIRSAYVEVIDAVTGGKLMLMTPEELTEALGEPLSAPRHVVELADIRRHRHWLEGTLHTLAGPLRSVDGLLLAASEALTNAWKHGKAARVSVRATGRSVQVLVVDEGPGIDFKTLPKATLTAGFSTTVSLGMGFTIMLDVCDRVLLATEPGFTAVVLEMGDGAPAG